MPFPTLPNAPTPEQIASFVTSTGEAISSSITDSATASEQAVSDGIKAATLQLTNIAEGARASIQASAEKAQRDVLDLLSQIQRLGGSIQDELALGTVNGEKFFEPITCLMLVVKATSSGAATIVFETREPSVVQALQAFAASSEAELRSKIREKLLQKIPIIPTQNAVGVDDVAMVMAIATLVLAVGVSIFVVCVGLALLYAISRNYDINDISMEWTGGGPKLRVGAIKR